MGSHMNIDYDKFPKQGLWLHKRTKVCFNFDSEKIIMGTIIRDDMEDPWLGLIILDDGRVVRTTECMHSPQ